MDNAKLTEIVTRHIVRNYGPVMSDGFSTPAVFVIPAAVTVLEESPNFESSRTLRALTNSIWDGYSGGSLAEAVATDILNDKALV